MIKPNGWIGSMDQFIHTLGTFGVQRDEDAKFICRGVPPCSFLGMGEEVVISEELEVLMPSGNWVSAVGLLHQTSYGCKVTVL